MADDAADAVTDSVAQVDVSALGTAPATTLGAIYQATAQALANAAHNAAASQQNTHIVAQAATTQGVALLYGLGAVAATIPKPGSKEP
ncbi:MAG: RebB family R body protein [Rhizomicrobium sp.]